VKRDGIRVFCGWDRVALLLSWLKMPPAFPLRTSTAIEHVFRGVPPSLIFDKAVKIKNSDGFEKSSIYGAQISAA
jgi:hypothetical protein